MASVTKNPAASGGPISPDSHCLRIASPPGIGSPDCADHPFVHGRDSSIATKIIAQIGGSGALTAGSWSNAAFTVISERGCPRRWPDGPASLVWPGSYGHRSRLITGDWDPAGAGARLSAGEGDGKGIEAGDTVKVPEIGRPDAPSAVMAVAATSRSCAPMSCPAAASSAQMRACARAARRPLSRQTGVVTGALAGASEVGCAAGLVRQRIDGAAGQ
jgi:hypothetical protein